MQLVNVAPSTEHSNVEPASLELNSNVTESSLIVEPSAGPESIVVSGAVPSTVKVREAGVWSVCPPATARTSNVWEPSERPG